MPLRIEVTQEAQTQVRELIKSQKPGTGVRVFLQSGGGGSGSGCGSGGSCGCGASGGQAFGMAFDKPRNGDEVVPVDGFSVLVDDMSAEFLDGAKIDFVQELDQSGFKVTAAQLADQAPASGGGCGCGSGGCC